MINVQEALRQQVLSELNNAEGRIEVISHRLEQRAYAFIALVGVRIDVYFMEDRRAVDDKGRSTDYHVVQSN
jgi:hypothetical protein